MMTPAESAAYDRSPWRSWAKTLSKLTMVAFAYLGITAWAVGPLKGGWWVAGLCIVGVTGVGIICDIVGLARREPRLPG